jgi:hypothetical protein
MNAQQALVLVRNKFAEETKGVSESDLATRYRDACQKFPVLMNTAHYIWAQGFAKRESPE